MPASKARSGSALWLRFTSRSERAAVFFLSLLFVAWTGPAAASTPAVVHRLEFPDRQAQYVDVRLTMPVTGESVELIMPTWTPGSYLIRDFSAHVERFSALGSGQRPLDTRKVSKNRWRVQSSGEQSITVSYSVWAGELSVNTSWVESGFALLNGAGVFLFSEASRPLPQILEVSPPQDWSQVHVALPREGAGQRFLARDYDELVDSPMLLGNATEHRFDVDGQEYALVQQDASGLWDGPRAAGDAARIVAAVQAFWGVNPLDRPYLIMNLVADGSAGLEHDHSAVLLSGHWQMRDRSDYIQWLALLTHEFFHAWNVRRLRPAALVDIDYEHEAYTEELWLAEGLTSYYDNLLLLRAGLISVDEFFALLAAEIHHYEITPGRQVRSAELSSLDSWIKQYKPDANSINSVVSYYRKGFLIGFVSDTAIRRETGHRLSLDDLLRDMYRRYGPGGADGPGYPPGTFETLLQSAAGGEVRREIESLLKTVQDPAVDATLDWYGLRLERFPARAAAEAAGRPAPVDFGLIWDPLAPDLIVEAVLRDGPAAAAGVLPADELLAINSTRVTRQNLPDRMLRLQPGDTVDLLLSRSGRVITLRVGVQHAISDKYQVSIQPGISRKQKERMETWLGVPLQFVRN